ncbi:MAG: hypothetical protein IKB38_10520 [Clostridia bacterium]|nr:hypothetical protein [Clostridia bacterium]
MEKNKRYYRYNCLGKDYAVVDFLNEGAAVPRGARAVRLGVSADAEIVLPYGADTAALLCVGHFLKKVRGLPISEFTADISGVLSELDFIDSESGIGVSLGKNGFKTERRTEELDGTSFTFDRVFSRKDSFCFLFGEESCSLAEALAKKYAGSTVCAAFLSESLLRFKTYPDAPFNEELAKALFYRYSPECVSDGKYDVRFLKKEGRTYFFADVSLDY